MLKGINVRTTAEVAGFAMSPVLGWNPYEAWTLARKVIGKREDAGDWLDWVGAGWESVYPLEVARAVQLSLFDRTLLLPSVLEYDNTERARPLSDFAVTLLDGHPFRAEERYSSRNRGVVDHYRRLRRSVTGARVDLFDGVCARLQSFNPEGPTLVFQRASYFDYLKTNLAMDHCVGTETLRQEIHAVNGRLHALEDSPLVNHAGINVLVFASGGEALIHRRSLRVLVRPSELCPSASGALAYRDVEGASAADATLADIAVHQEVEEELGWRVAESVRGQTVFLGLTRELVRGGKPEMFFAAVSTLTCDEIRQSYDDSEGGALESAELIEVEFAPYHTEPLPELSDPSRAGDFKRRLGLVLDELESVGRLSIPLLTNVALWYRYKMAGHA